MSAVGAMAGTSKELRVAALNQVEIDPAGPECSYSCEARFAAAVFGSAVM